MKKTRLNPAELTAPWGNPNIERMALTETRIAHIADLMRTMKFRTGDTIYKLVDEWGLGIDRVKQLSTMASRRVKDEIANPDHVTVTLCTALSQIVDEGMRPGGDRKQVISAAKCWAEIAGAFAPKVVVSIDKTELPDDPDALIAIAREEMAKYEGTIVVKDADGNEV